MATANTKRTRRYGGGSVYSYNSPAGVRYRWQAWVPVNPLEPDGEQKRISKGGYLSGKLAQVALEEALQLVKKHKPAKSSKMKLADYSEIWLRVKTSNLANSTVYGYRKIVRVHIIPNLGALPLGRITPSKVSDFYQNLTVSGRRDGKQPNGPLTANTVNKVHIVLGSILEHAYASGLIPLNPARQKAIVEAPTGKLIREQAQEIQTWSAEDLAEFLRWSSEVDQDDLAPLWLLVAKTGLRRGEAGALQWGDINFRERAISIRRAADPVKSKATKLPKTGQARNVILDSESLAALRTLRMERAALSLDFVAPEAYVFGTYKNEMRTPNDVTARWSSSRKRYLQEHPNALPISLKVLRHTHATLLLQAGVSAKIVQERLGHSNIATTLNIYSHVTPTIQREAIERFEEWTKASTS